MYRYLILFLILFFAWASADAENSLRVGNNVLTVGDSAARVQQLMGDPALRTFDYQIGGGMPGNQLITGEAWQYAQGRKTIIITLVGGRVTNFDMTYD